MSTVPVPSRQPETASLNGHSLARAFASFTEAAASLERSYTQLQAEVARLRRELEDTNRDLTRSLAVNHRMRLRLNRILERLPCGVLVVEADGSIAIANPETQRLLGVKANQPLPAGLRRLLQCARSSSELEYDGGETRWISIRPARVEGDAGASAIFIFQDISGLKRLEREHGRLRRRQALAEMSTLLAHEIRNPLGSLELFVGLLAGSHLEGEQRAWVEHLQAGLRTLAATVNNVLHFHSEPQPQLAPLEVGQLLRSVQEFLRPLARQAKVTLQLADHLDGAQIAGDRHRLEQVLLNLALNAFRFMPGGGVLKLAARPSHGAGVRIEVADTGPGIAPENLDRLFQPGFTTRPGSPGLGLAVCKTIMEQHGGTISVTCRPGCGSTFRLEFPGIESGGGQRA